MPSLTSMAEAILTRAKKLDSYLESNNISYPSFDEDTLDQLPDALQDDRLALANSSNEVKKLTRGAAMGTMDTALSPGEVVVDIGGGNGQISQYLARHTSNTRFVVQDLPYVVSEAPAKLPKDLKDRIDSVNHDFHKPQTMNPPPAAFLLRYILHNWSDKYSVNILKNLVPAMRKDSKVLIYEYVLEDGPVTDMTARFGFQMDGIMATFFNAQERTAREFELVLKAADERYVVNAVRLPKGSTMSIVEMGWSG